MNRATIEWDRHFAALADEIIDKRQAGEEILCSLCAEQSDFIRFNAAKVRQIGSVQQGYLTLRLISGERSAYSTLTVSGSMAQDLAEVGQTLLTLRAGLLDTGADPHLLFDQSSWQRTTFRTGRVPSAEALVRTVGECAKGLDFVGFYAGGAVIEGFASSTGSRGWYQVSNFNFSWSLYDANGRAIKTSYAGDDWDDAVFARKVDEAARRLEYFAHAPKVLTRGSYRTYFAPAAMQELIGLIGYEGFSAREHATARSPLYKLNSGVVHFDPRIALSEDLELGLSPAFNEDGYLRESVSLIAQGRAAGQLTSARSAREFGLQPNGANASEMTTSLSMAGGALPEADVLAALGTGLYVGNLWYLNVSDRTQCRLTGMTRFATFWVEDGQIRAPVDAMRFDDSLYRLLGSEVEHLTDTSELLLEDSTWGRRRTGGMKLPGMVVRSFELTL
jgi:predicted Zn-dependent protease